MEHVLLAVAAGVGLALLPETVTERRQSPAHPSTRLLNAMAVTYGVPLVLVSTWYLVRI